MTRAEKRRKSLASSSKNEENEVAEEVGGGGGEGEDRLSNLPECILTDILSRLPTRDAIQTCVLSKKWEFSWTKIYNLDFNDIYFRSRGRTTRERFSFFVDRILMHCRTTSLNNFNLHCSSTPAINYDPYRIHTWLYAAFRKNVQILRIDLRRVSFLMPRFTIYDAPKRLEELIILSPLTLRVPDDVLFLTLRKLDFSQVVLLGKSNRKPTAVPAPPIPFNGGDKVVLSLPLLEYLNLYCCEWRDVSGVRFEVPNLTSFNVTIVSHNYVIKEFLKKFTFVIAASSKLTHVKLCGELLEKYDFWPSNKSLSTIQKASMMLTLLPRDWVNAGNRIMKTLKQMLNVLFLELSAESIFALKKNLQSPTDSPVFKNLIHLKLHTADYWFTDGAAFVGVMNCTPVLQTLTVEMVTTAGNDLQYYVNANASENAGENAGEDAGENAGEDAGENANENASENANENASENANENASENANASTEEKEIVPACFRTHLKVVQFVSAYNCLKKEKDTYLIKFILENASVLEQLQFIDPLKRSSVPCYKVRRFVLNYPRASSAVKIVFK